MIHQMKIYLLFLGILFTSTTIAHEQAADSTKTNILILHSYHHQFKWNQDITNAITRNLHPEYEIFQKYMDTKRNFDSLYFETINVMLSRQYKLNQYKLVIVTDNNAFEYAKKHQQDIFNGIPIIFCGVNYVTPEELAPFPNITGVNEDVHLLKSMELIKKLQPNADTLVVIIDKTTTGKRITDEILRIGEDLTYPFKTIKIVNDLSMELLEKQLPKFTNKCAILFGLFFRDAENKFFDYDESAERMSKASKLPVFGLWDFSLGYGITGGYLADGHAQGEAVAKLAKLVLDGVPPNDIPIIWESPNHYKFDYIQLKKFDIDLDLLPKESTLINEPYSLLKHNPRLFKQITAAITILSILSILLIIAAAKYRRLSRKYNQKNDYLKTILKAIGDGIIEVDNHNIIKHMNPAAEIITGYNEHEAREEKLDNIYTPTPANKTLHEHTYHTFTNRNGKNYSITELYTPIHINEKTTGKILSITDISNIIEKENQFSRLTENAKDLIYRIKIPEGIFEYVSPASNTLLGYTPDELYGSSGILLRFIPKPWKKYVLRKWLELKSGIINGSFELEITDKKGNTKWVNQRSVLIFDIHGNPMAMEGIATDISDQKRIETQLIESNIALEKAKERAEESDRLKSAFLANIAHEIRTPMNGIMGFSELLRNSRAKHNSQSKFINLIQQSSKRMLNIIDDLVNIAQIEAGQITPNIKLVNIGNILKDIAASFSEPIALKKLKFTYKAGNCGELDKAIQTDPYKLDYTIRRLLDNAIKYTKEGEIILTCAIEDKQLTITITDTGVGIAEEHQRIIFERFMQADNSPFKAEEGTGLGLAIARAFVETLGGEISLQSKIGQGSSFTFYIPVY